jgi:orotate phosphoribosyltransferase-like protein
MSWAYRPVKNITPKGDIYWTVREYHYSPMNCYTADDICPSGSTRKELIQCLKYMLADCKKRKPMVIRHKELPNAK